MAAKKKHSKNRPAPAAAPSLWREDGTHVESAPMSQRTTWIHVTSREPIKMRQGRAVAGHRTRVTPAEAERLVAQGVAEILPGI